MQEGKRVFAYGYDKARNEQIRKEGGALGKQQSQFWLSLTGSHPSQ